MNINIISLVIFFAMLFLWFSIPNLKTSNEYCMQYAVPIYTMCMLYFMMIIHSYTNIAHFDV